MNTIAHITLVNGGFTVVDADLHEWLSRWEWHSSKNGYAYRYERFQPGPNGVKKIYLHTVVNGTPSGLETDHINRNGFDNRRENLRTATSLQNKANQKKKIRLGKASSRYKGVYFSKKQKKWIASLSINRKTVSLGAFATEEEAARRYNAKAIELYGDFAGLNQLN